MYQPLPGLTKAISGSQWQDSACNRICITISIRLGSQSCSSYSASHLARHEVGSEKKMVLTVFNSVLQARLEQTDVTHLWQENPTKTARQDLQEVELRQLNETLDSFRNSLVELYLEAVSTVTDVDPETLKDVSYSVPAIQGLDLLFQIPNYPQRR